MSKFKYGDHVVLPSGEFGKVITVYPTSKNDYHLVLKENHVGVVISGKELMPAPVAEQKQNL